MKKWKINLLMLVFIMGAIGVLELNTQLKYNLNLVDYYKYNRGYNKSLENIDDERALTIGVYDEAPIAYLNQFNNYNTGLVVDYISQISIEIRSDIHLKVLQKGELFDALEQGTVDGVVAERTEDRADIFEFTQMLCVVRGRVAVPVKTGVGSIEELRGKTLVTLVSDNKGNRITSFFERYDDIEVIEVENMYQCFALINNDIAVGFVGDDMEVARYLNVTSRDTSYVFLKPILYEEEICLALLKGNEELLSTLNKGVLELKKKNLIAQTQYKWLGDFDSDSIDIKQVELANKVVFSISVIVVFFSIWNYTIAQKVNIKTRELSESEEKLRLIVNSIQSGIVVLEDESTIVACNDAMSKLIGVDQEALLGNTYRTIEPLKPFMKPENINQSFKLGNAYYYVTKRPFSERKTLVVIEDYTEKHIHEMRVRQEEKMIAVGQLSAGLAHEIRNPLGLIKSYSYIIEKYCEGAIEKHAITVINDSVRRINTLIESLLRFSKLSNNALKLIDIESLLQDIVLLVERTVDLKGIKIAYKTRGEKTKTVVVNEDVLKMVLLNLINNSIDSFKSVEKPNKAIEVVITVLASELRIMVKDNGCGIEKDVQENIFNPFYSTKETGVGLGLYIISTEIAHHEGVITVDSELGIGTEFNIVLPIKER